MSLPAEKPITTNDAPSFGSDGKPVAPKVKSPETVRRMHQADWDADSPNRLTRAWVQGIMEGKPPFSPEKLRSAGLAGVCNIDWRYGQLAIRKKVEPYVLMLNSLPYFLNIKTRRGTPQQRNSWNRIMSEKHARVLRSWDAFTFRHLYNILYLCEHGASFCYFNDNTDWRWSVSTLGEMVVPRLSKADATEFSRISTIVQYEPSFLWKEIRHCGKGQEWSNPETQDGWHVPTVKAAIEAAVGKEFFKGEDWELNERLWKAREIRFNDSSRVCSCILMWLVEDDGRVSQYTVTESSMTPKGKAQENFIFKKDGYFNSMRSGVVVFTRDIGTNGYFHSIRGTGNDIFPIVQKLNELECSMYDALKVEMSIPIKATEEVFQNEMAFVQAGPYLLIQEGVEIVPRQAANYSNSAFPGIQMLRNNLADQSGNSKLPDQPGQKADLLEQLSNVSGLDVMEGTLFNIPWQRLLRESLRRMIAIKSSSEPGGPEAFEFRKLCMEAGVPEEAINDIDIEECVAVKAIGNGSPQARLFTMNGMKELMPQFDEEGRRACLRDIVSAYPGMDYSNVDRYVPEPADMRPDQHVRNAVYENFILQSGGQAPVLPNDEHLVHLDEHIKAMSAIAMQVEQGQIGIEQAVQPLTPLYMHSNEHMQMQGETKAMEGKLSVFRMAMNNLFEIISNGQKKLTRMQEEQAQQQQGPPNAQEGPSDASSAIPEGLSPGQYKQLVQAQVRLQEASRNAVIRDEMHRLKMEQLQKDGAQRRQLKDLQTAAAIASK